MRDEHHPSPIIGARRFHKWATSQLPPEVLEHYGERFVLATHRLLADGPAGDRGTLFLAVSMQDGRLPAKPELSDKLRCPDLNLCNPARQAVEIAANGWRIVERPPVCFVRSRVRGMAGSGVTRAKWGKRSIRIRQPRMWRYSLARHWRPWPAVRVPAHRGQRAGSADGLEAERCRNRRCARCSLGRARGNRRGFRISPDAERGLASVRRIPRPGAGPAGESFGAEAGGDLAP